MKITVRSKNLDLSARSQQQTAERVEHALQRFERSIGEAIVRFEDINGTKGGVDITCGIQVHLTDGRQVLVHETAENAALALDGALDRLRRAVARNQKKEEKRRHDRQPLVPEKGEFISDQF